MKTPLLKDWKPGHVQVALFVRAADGTVYEYDSKTLAPEHPIAKTAALTISLALGVHEASSALAAKLPDIVKEHIAAATKMPSLAKMAKKFLKEPL